MVLENHSRSLTTEMHKQLCTLHSAKNDANEEEWGPHLDWTDCPQQTREYTGWMEYVTDLGENVPIDVIWGKGGKWWWKQKLVDR